MVEYKNGKWFNTIEFRKRGLDFEKNGYYCSYIKNSLEWINFWETELNYCTNGYNIEKYKITNDHYFYLNYTPIEKVLQNKSKVSKKIIGFPDFWDGDYDYFWCLHIAEKGVINPDSQSFFFLTENEKKNVLENKYSDKEKDELCENVLYDRIHLKIKIYPGHYYGGYDFIVGKARRKGFSYKNSSITTNVYNSIRNSLVIIGASDKKFLYPKGTMGMVNNMINFLNENTGWSKSRDYVNKINHKRASYKTYVNDIEVEKGYKSEIMAISFNDNPEAARGKSANKILFEEAGIFPNLKKSVLVTQSTTEAGNYKTGQIIVFGTSGDLGGDSMDFAEMFYSPLAYNFLPFVNTWDKDEDNKMCGFFFPIQKNMEGFYDEHGNSFEDLAYEREMKEREKIKNNTNDITSILQRMQEFPTCPKEAFLINTSSIFPVEAIKNQLNKILIDSKYVKKGHPVKLYYENNKVVAKLIINENFEVIRRYKDKFKSSKKSVPIIYEYPIENIPSNLYKIAYDPVRHDSGTSLSCIVVYKGNILNKGLRNTIVAEYIGRTDEVNESNEIAMMLAELYNAKILYENEVTHVKNFFRQRKKLHLLAEQPDLVISKSIKNSYVSRVYGIHMTKSLKSDGLKYLKDWLMEVRDYDDENVVYTNLDFIYSPIFLEELIYYNTKDNFDYISAMIILMFFLQEEDLQKEYKIKENDEDDIYNQILNLKLFNKKKYSYVM